jgi:hypothetical protein
MPRYFVEVNVIRPSSFTRNYRDCIPLTFRTIELPPPLGQDTQTFVRTRHTLSPVKRIWNGLFRQQSMPGHANVSFQARLPSPAILVCNEPIPVSLILKRENGAIGIVHVESVEIVLNIITSAKVKGIPNDIKTSLPILVESKLGLVLAAEEDELLIDSSHFIEQGAMPGCIRLPPSLLPSFSTCNIARTYSLVVRMKVRLEKSNIIELLQLTADVHVFSGPTVASSAEQLETESLPTYLSTLDNTN